MLQKQVQYFSDMDDGFPGQLGRAMVTTITYPYTLIDPQNKVNPGDFVMGEYGTGAQAENIKHAKAAKGSLTNKVILGVVLDEGMFLPSANLNSGGDIPNGHIITVLTHGAVWIKTTAVAKEGQWLFLKTQDASQAYDYNPTKADHTATGFKVVQGGKANKLIMIEKI